jgi:hypothetical protein
MSTEANAYELSPLSALERVEQRHRPGLRSGGLGLWCRRPRRSTGGLGHVGEAPTPPVGDRDGGPADPLDLRDASAACVPFHRPQRRRCATWWIGSSLPSAAHWIPEPTRPGPGAGGNE